MSGKTRVKTTSSKRGRGERSARSSRRFDISCAALAVVILLALLSSLGRPYELGVEESSGFAAWFLLMIGYLPLMAVSLCKYLFGVNAGWLDQLIGSERHVWALAICDWVFLGVVWAAVRLLGRRYGLLFIRSATTLVLIVMGWGIFQLFCMWSMLVWSGGGMTPLHRHLHRESVREQVIYPENSSVEPVMSPENSGVDAVAANDPAAAAKPGEPSQN